MDEAFDLMPSAAEAMEGLRSVHHELLLIALEDATATSHLVVEAAGRIEAAGMSGSTFVPPSQRLRGWASGVIRKVWSPGVVDEYA